MRYKNHHAQHRGKKRAALGHFCMENLDSRPDLLIVRGLKQETLNTCFFSKTLSEAKVPGCPGKHQGFRVSFDFLVLPCRANVVETRKTAERRAVPQGATTR